MGSAGGGENKNKVRRGHRWSKGISPNIPTFSIEREFVKFRRGDRSTGQRGREMQRCMLGNDSKGQHITGATAKDGELAAGDTSVKEKCS